MVKKNGHPLLSGLLNVGSFFFFGKRSININLFHAYVCRLSWLWIPDRVTTVHMHTFMQSCQVMSIHFPSVAGVKPIQHTPFSHQNGCRAPIKINYFWRSASLHCNIVCKILLPSTSLKTNTHVLVKVEFLTVLAFSRLERIMRCLWVQSGLSWSYQVRSEWPVVPLLLDSRHELQQTAESAASS